MTLFWFLIMSAVTLYACGRLWYQTSSATFSTARGYSIATETETTSSKQSCHAARRCVRRRTRLLGCGSTILLEWTELLATRRQPGCKRIRIRHKAVRCGPEVPHRNRKRLGVGDPWTSTTRFGKELANEDICEQRCTNRGRL